ncbi:sugar transferase [Dechloromonas denitrificans]|uniref:sugar transferase n=1 Tax=Dechloromonas denitrificans TaxID=281362 RepID=UPI001CF99FFE|nr:sugar transferase [Dechloromonas denitrificans]UCV06648.1 sugar transferase [Dechloromonas denitrificans]
MSNYERWKMLRLVDLTLAILGLVVGLPVLLLLLICGFLDTGSPLFFQARIGRQQKPFVLVKFRTMKPDTVSVATHLADASAITRFGKFLRKTKLDELPQLWNVFKGEMSLVGPRPCLLTQIELIEEREKRKVFDARPGITGLAQINAIDMSTPNLLAETDELMLKELSFSSYLKYILLTLFGKGAGDRIKETAE